jgi:hypothetical protein
MQHPLDWLPEVEIGPGQVDAKTAAQAGSPNT